MEMHTPNKPLSIAHYLPLYHGTREKLYTHTREDDVEEEGMEKEAQKNIFSSYRIPRFVRLSCNIFI